MSLVLFISTIAMCVSGFLISLVYVWLNASTTVKDIDVRNRNILKISKRSIVLTLISALCCCLLSNPNDVNTVMAKISILCFIIALSWIVVILVCGITMLVLVVSKSKFREKAFTAIKNLFSIAFMGAVASMLLSWLLS